MSHGRLLLFPSNQPFPVASEEPSHHLLCSGSAVSRVGSRLPWGEDPDPKLLFACCKVSRTLAWSLAELLCSRLKWRDQIFPFHYHLGKAGGEQSPCLHQGRPLLSSEQVAIQHLEDPQWDCLSSVGSTAQLLQAT